MKEKGRNILPMIGFIILAGLLLGGLALSKRIGGENGIIPPVQRVQPVEEVNIPRDNFNGANAKVNFPGGYTVDEYEELTLAGIDCIKIESISSELKINYITSDKVTARYYGTIQTTSKDALPWLEAFIEGRNAVFRIKYSQLFSSSLNEKTNLDIAIPENWAGDIIINNVSGKVSLQELRAQDISISSVSGAISADKLAGESIEVRSTSGNINIGQLTAFESFKGENISGKYTVNTLECEEAELSTTSGNISLIDVLCDEISIKSISGSIDITMKNGSADIDTASGSVKAKFINGFDKIKAKSISGSVNLYIPEESQFKADINTISGKIDLSDFSMRVNSSEKNRLKGTVGNGDGSIKIDTSSGSVHVKKN